MASRETSLLGIGGGGGGGWGVGGPRCRRVVEAINHVKEKY